jgi:hypothetical protein
MHFYFKRGLNKNGLPKKTLIIVAKIYQRFLRSKIKEKGNKLRLTVGARCKQTSQKISATARLGVKTTVQYHYIECACFEPAQYRAKNVPPRCQLCCYNSNTPRNTAQIYHSVRGLCRGQK